MLLMPKGIPFTAGSVSAPVTAIATSPPRTRAVSPPKVTSIVARSAGLDYQPVGQRMRAPIRGAGAGDPKMRQAGPAEVFDQGQRPRAHDFQRRRTGAERLGT